MRIAFFTHRFPVTSEAFIINAVAGLLQAGHDVDVYALHGEGDFSAELLFSRSRAGGQFKHFVFRLRETPRRRLALAPFAALELLSKHGLTSLRAIGRHWFGSDGPRLVALHEASLFRNHGKYDVLHCQFGTLAEQVLNHRDAGFLTGQVFVHFRGYDISSHVQDRGISVYADVFSRADGFLTNCDFFRRKLLDAGTPAHRTCVVPSPVNVDLFQYRKRPWIPGETVRLLCVGRLVEKKGFQYALEAIAGLRANGLDVSCKIIGDGPLRLSLEALASSLAIGECVTFAGAGTQADISGALQDAHIFIAPSVRARNGDEDASINTLKEAMAVGCPFVSTLHGGIPELANGLDGGVLVPERNGEAVRDGVITLLSRSKDWAELGKQARTHVLERYAIAAATASLLAVYNGAQSQEAEPKRATK